MIHFFDKDGDRKLEYLRDRLANSERREDLFRRKIQQERALHEMQLYKVKTENRKLRKSLRKLYEKYIKPTQGMKLHSNRKDYNRDKSLLFGSRYATRPYTSSDPTLIGLNYLDSDGTWRTIKAAPKFLPDIVNGRRDDKPEDIGVTLSPAFQKMEKEVEASKPWRKLFG